MKNLILTLVLLLTLPLIAPTAMNNVEDRIEIIKIANKLNFSKELKNYTKDIGVKYKYSNRAKDFLTQENLELIINNCDSYPSVIIAMAIIETGWGHYAIGNNYFGIKGKGHIRKTKEWDGNKYITITDSFQQYKSKADNIRAVSNLLNNRRYNIEAASNYKEAAHLVKKGGYATDPLYANKIKFIIEKYELYRLDDIKNKFTIV